MPSVRKTSSKAAGELAVAIVDQKAHPVEQHGEAEVARLLRHPGAGGIGRAAREVDAAALEFDEEEHVETAQRVRLDREEVTRKHARGLSSKELLPARSRAPRRRCKPACKHDAPDRAGRDTQAELEPLASDPRVPQPGFSCANRSASSRTRRSTGGRPGLRRGCVHLRRTSSRCQRRSVWGAHHQCVATAGPEQSGERGEQCAICRPQQGVVAFAGRARPADAATPVTPGLCRTRCVGPSPAAAAQPETARYANERSMRAILPSPRGGGRNKNLASGLSQPLRKLARSDTRARA
jgi:hypothetical protein